MTVEKIEKERAKKRIENLTAEKVEKERERKRIELGERAKRPSRSAAKGT